MKRGRKQDNTLPPSRSREIQRAFRQRRSDYIRGLEHRVGQLECEVDEILARHGEVLRYTTAEVVAARSASRKKQKNKSKHNLSQFMDVNQLMEPSTPESPAFLTSVQENSQVAAPSPSITSSHDIRPDLSCGARYLLGDVNGGLSSGQSSPQYSKPSFPKDGHPGNDHEYDCRGNNPTSILSRRSKPLLRLWNDPAKSNDNSLSCQSSNPTTSSQGSLPMTCDQYHGYNSHIEMFMEMDSVVPPPEMSSQLSSIVFQPEMRAPPHCSLPPLLADSSPRNDPLPSAPFNSYHSNPDVDSPSYACRTFPSQISDRFNSRSYTFIDSPHHPNSVYHQGSPMSLFRSRSSMSDQTNLQTGSLSTLIAIAATRLDHFEPHEPDCGYQVPTLHPSPPTIETSIPPDALGSSEALQAQTESTVRGEYSKSTRTHTPCSTTPSEPKELDQISQYDSHPPLNGHIPFEDFGSNGNSSCLSFYQNNTTKDWRDENMNHFAKESNCQQFRSEQATAALATGDGVL